MESKDNDFHSQYSIIQITEQPEKGKNKIHSWFQTSAIIKPKYDDAIVQKRLLEADAKTSALQTKYARARKNNSNQPIADIETPEKSGNSSQVSNSVESNVTMLSGFSSPNNSQSFKKLPSSCNDSKKSNMNPPFKPVNIPSLQSQNYRLEQVRIYDIRNGTDHCTVLAPTKSGLHCEVCDKTYTDMSSIIRYDTNGLLQSHCHIGTNNHQEGNPYF